MDIGVATTLMSNTSQSRICIKAVAEFLEEVAVKHLTDAQQQAAVYAVLLEDAVHRLAVAAHLGGEPRDRALLALQFLLDCLADVYHRWLVLFASPRPMGNST